MSRSVCYCGHPRYYDYRIEPDGAPRNEPMRSGMQEDGSGTESLCEDAQMTTVVRCYACLTRQLCPDAHCDPNDPAPVVHDPTAVDLDLVPEAVTIYHGRALCLPCTASYLDSH
jgi:hypothetical protein